MEQMEKKNLDFFKFNVCAGNKSNIAHVMELGIERAENRGNGQNNKYKHFLLFQPYFKPFPKQQILEPSKLKEFADDKFKYDENSSKFIQIRNG